jgi:hypothetical protein
MLHIHPIETLAGISHGSPEIVAPVTRPAVLRASRPSAASADLEFSVVAPSVRNAGQVPDRLSSYQNWVPHFSHALQVQLDECSENHAWIFVLILTYAICGNLVHCEVTAGWATNRPQCGQCFFWPDIAGPGFHSGDPKLHERSKRCRFLTSAHRLGDPACE